MAVVETGEFDPDRPVRSDEIGGRLVLHQDDPDDPHPLAKTAYLSGSPSKVVR